MSIKKTVFFGHEAVELTAFGYSALIVTGYGCNLVTLKDEIKNIDILKTPDTGDYDEFINAPQHFGNAVLFPPNRIDNGTYTRNGITYNFVHEGSYRTKDNRLMYSHGILRFMKFDIESIIENDDNITMSAAFHSVPGDRIYKDFPHEFICKIKFILSSGGLMQTISFTNLGSIPMPLGAGFHTAFKLPNDAVSKRDDYRIVYSADEHIELNERSLPTGNLLPLYSDCRNEGILPFDTIADEHTTIKPITVNGKTFHGAIIKNIETNNNIYFETNNNFPFWMLWNNNARSNYICIEPMSWIINAPNSTLPDDKSGYMQLEAGETWTGELKFYTEA